MPTVKNHSALGDGIDVEDESKTPVGHGKCMFWQTSINDQRPKLRVCINGIIIYGLIDMDASVSIITPESWHWNWPLQEAGIQFLGIGTLS